MRKRKVIKIDDREITVKELTAEQILGMIEGEQDSIGDLKSKALELYPDIIDIPLKDLKKMAPSEIKEIYDGFREVNAVFFDVARFVSKSSLTKEFLKKIQSALLADFGCLLVDSLKPGTQEPSSTDTPSS